MDINILLALQNMREGAPDILTGFLSLLSLIADGPGLVAIVMVVYWCVSKRAGQFTIAAFMMSNLVCQFLKNLLCIYRPWVREPRITPPESVLEGAGGYSFPSGHASGATTSLGSFAWLLRKGHLLWSIILIVVVALIVFSRLYLGVHTPQDVLVAVGIGVLAIWLVNRFVRWFEDNQDKDVFVAIVVIAVSLITLIIVIVKPYPLDYVNGKLLVDPIEMQKGSFEASGVVIGVMLGWLLERRMVRFSTDVSAIDSRGRIIRGVVGVVIVGVVYLAGNALFKAMLGLLWGKFLAMMALTFVAMFVVPFVFTWLEQTRFVPYAGVPAPRSASAGDGQRALPDQGGRAASDRPGSRASSGRGNGRSSSGRASSGRKQRGSSGRSSSGRKQRGSSDRTSSGRKQQESSDRPRSRDDRGQRPQSSDARPAQGQPRESLPDKKPVRGPETEGGVAGEQVAQEAAPVRSEQRNAALDSLPSIEKVQDLSSEFTQGAAAQAETGIDVAGSTKPPAERLTLPEIQGADMHAAPDAADSARPRLNRLDIPSPRN